MTVYKLKHIPTGLFYRPSKHGAKANLSKHGKSYSRKPSLAHIGDIYRFPLPKDPKNRWREDFENRRVIASEWIIVEFGEVSAK